MAEPGIQYPGPIHTHWNWFRICRRPAIRLSISAGCRGAISFNGVLIIVAAAVAVAVPVVLGLLPALLPAPRR